MSKALNAYGLVFTPAPYTSVEQQNRGQLLTLHNSPDAALAYYQAHRATLLKTYSDPATTRDDGKTGIPLATITESSCLGSAHTLSSLRRKIAHASKGADQCLQVRHQHTAAQPEIYANELNKIIKSGEQNYHTLPSPPESPQPQKKSVRNPSLKPA
jgi:hypothetical protein